MSQWANSLPVPWSPAWVGFCLGRAGGISPAKGCKRPFLGLFSHCFWCSQEVTGWAFTMGIVVETSEGCNPWHGIISQLQMNIHPLFFFSKEALVLRSPIYVICKHNFSSHPKQPLGVSLPPRSLSILRCTRSRGRKMRYYSAHNKVQKQDH